MYPIIDSKQVLNNIRLFEDNYKIYTIDLIYSLSGGNNHTYIIYPFEIAFYEYLVNKKKNNFRNQSFADYNSILFLGIINRILSIIELEDPNLIKSKINSIFYLLINWLKDCTNKFKLPEFFDFENNKLIICKYCLKQFEKNTDNIFTGTTNCLCNTTCSNDYTNFLNDELVHWILYSEIEVGLLYNAASNLLVNTEDLSFKDNLNKSKLYLKASIQAISQHFLKRLKSKRSLFSKEDYKTYDNKSMHMKSKTDYRETKLLAEYKKAYVQGNNQRINDLLNGNTGDIDIDKLADFKKLRAIDIEVSPRVKSWKH